MEWWLILGHLLLYYSSFFNKIDCISRKNLLNILNLLPAWPNLSPSIILCFLLLPWCSLCNIFLFASSDLMFCCKEMEEEEKRMKIFEIFCPFLSKFKHIRSIVSIVHVIFEFRWLDIWRFRRFALPRIFYSKEFLRSNKRLTHIRIISLMDK